MTQLVLVGILTSAVVLATILWLIRTRRLQERFAILWIVAAAVIVVFGAWKTALHALARASGIAYPPSALFLLVLAFVLGALLQAAVVLTRLSAQNQRLAQRLALLDERLRRVEAREGDGDDIVATGVGRPEE